jgi:hypothetical protein
MRYQNKLNSITYKKNLDPWGCHQSWFKKYAQIEIDRLRNRKSTKVKIEKIACCFLKNIARIL